MKSSFRLIHQILSVVLLAASASASPIKWTLNGVTLSDGGTASGTFTYNPDSGTPCGSFSPCGTYSSVDIVTTNGSSRTGAIYSFVCGQNVVSCTGVSPDSTEVLFLTSNAANQTGDSAIAFFFTGIGVFPPQGLTDGGGVVDISSDSGSVGTVQESTCLDAACTSPSLPVRASTAGTVSSTVPEPASWLLLLGGLTALVVSQRWRLTRSGAEPGWHPHTRFQRVLLACLLASATVSAAADDPFVGTWVYNSGKSPKPTIRYTIKDLGDSRYALTGSTGQTLNIKADGATINSPLGGTVSFKKIDDYRWQMVRADPKKMVRTYTVSSDEKNLTLNDVFTRATGKKDRTVTKYARVTPGKSIFGEWQSISMNEESTGEPGELFIKPYGKDGLSFTSSLDNNRLDMNFDGKMYFQTGRTVRKGDATSGKRVTAHLLMSEGQMNGQPDDKEEWRVSDDGKTLTIIARPVKSSAVFTSVFDKK